MTQLKQQSNTAPLPPTCVRSNMLLEVARLFKCLLAKCTDMQLSAIFAKHCDSTLLVLLLFLLLLVLLKFDCLNVCDFPRWIHFTRELQSILIIIVVIIHTYWLGWLLKAGIRVP